MPNFPGGRTDRLDSLSSDPTRFRSKGLERCGLTLVEMLVAMAITLVMMAAVVTLFANVSSSVTNRRATVEMASQIRTVRNLLQSDLAGATCPAIPWQKIDSNHGYLEIIEGPLNDVDPSFWLRDVDSDRIADGVGTVPGIDVAQSSLPSSTLFQLPLSDPTLSANDVRTDGGVTDGRGLGDADDILMLTSRSKHEPFVGRVPDDVSGSFYGWTAQSMQSTLAEIVWYAIENPVEPDGNKTFYFGEPGYRTIYRRALLIAPWLDYKFPVGSAVTGPGVVRVLGNAVDRDDLDQALAALIAFQERFDLSVRLEWDSLLGTDGRWTITANSLADLTKRENRYEHHGFTGVGNPRSYPFALASIGSGYGGTPAVAFQVDRDSGSITPGTPPLFSGITTGGGVALYRAGATAPLDAGPFRDRAFRASRPFAYVNAGGTAVATARAILNEDGRIVAVTHGLAPLSGQRRGEDVMLTNALAFDLRVFDPGAPLYEFDSDRDFTNANSPEEVVQPGDAGWIAAYRADLADTPEFGDVPGVSSSPDSRVWRWRLETSPGVFARGAQGVYVDLGYGFPAVGLAPFAGFAAGTVGVSPQFFQPRSIRDLAPGYALYDTWSFHYENNGLDEDGDGLVDEATNGFDDDGQLGVDDVGERETRPPYDATIRGLQVTLRGYERDSRQIREVKIKQPLMPK